MTKLLLATAAVIALASPAMAGSPTDNPTMAQNVFVATPGQEGTIDGCKNHAINVYAKAGGHDIETTNHAVWAVFDFEDHAYAVSIFCKNDKGVLVFTAAGADEKGTSAILNKLADTWNGPREEEAKADPQPQPTAKTIKKHRS